MKRICFINLLIGLLPYFLYLQQVIFTSGQIKILMTTWNGDRFSDGRLKVSDQHLERFKNVHLETAWEILRNKGF
ncbi:MAG: hypothetical protein SFU21_16810 [Flavihumibacter sp.]|nr:hypothetical protein [Flavihumibacter sp.]